MSTDDLSYDQLQREIGNVEIIFTMLIGALFIELVCTIQLLCPRRLALRISQFKKTDI